MRPFLVIVFLLIFAFAAAASLGTSPAPSHAGFGCPYLVSIHAGGTGAGCPYLQRNHERRGAATVCPYREGVALPPGSREACPFIHPGGGLKSAERTIRALDI